METLNIATLSILVEAQKRLADAERRYAATHDKNASNPFEGESAKLAELQRQLDDLRDLEAGATLNQAIAEYDARTAELAQVRERRTAADATLANMTQNETVQKWMGSKIVAMNTGHGHTWEVLRPWLLSCKTRSFAPIQAGAMDSPNWPNELTLSDQEREVIARFEAAKSQCDILLVQQNDIESRIRILVQQNPELLAMKKVA